MPYQISVLGISCLFILALSNSGTAQAAPRANGIEDMPGVFNNSVLIARDPADGINCQGLYYCLSGGGDSDPSTEILSSVRAIPDDVLYEHHEVIACAYGINYPDDSPGYLCAWLDYADHTKDDFYGKVENRWFRTGKTIKEMVKRLVDHGCKRCGSIPMDYDSNMLYTGFLTMNARRTGCPKPKGSKGAVGVCSEGHKPDEEKGRNSDEEKD
ncbi:hypothetical protein Dda_0037 [Drechslerella dactyloides]|uniref:Killer toxin Kp4 domain-containing protein n=1 Tax=Drechslerella dactyloides TaxID=74499 RepID=A0AAD6J405_DREDA|nr:hypothetical protein Dda_0037 [Drechslerella dactyloides]